MKELFGFPISFAVCYLLGAFIYATLDIMAWDFGGRALCVFFGLMWGFALCVRIRMEYLNE